MMENCDSNCASILKVGDRRLQISDFGKGSCKTPQAGHIAKQVLRSGTAAAANYAEARGAESRSDFIHKLRIVLKELNETAVWLQLIMAGSLLRSDKIVAVVAENEELCRILAASIRTAGGFERS